MDEHCQVVKLRLRPGATEPELIRARPGFVGGFKGLFPELVEARLVRLEDGSYVDIWRWASAESALRALDQREQVEGYGGWDSLVEVISFEQGPTISQ